MPENAVMRKLGNKWHGQIPNHSLFYFELLIARVLELHVRPEINQTDIDKKCVNFER